MTARRMRFDRRWSAAGAALLVGAALTAATAGSARAAEDPVGWSDGFLLDRGLCGQTQYALDSLLIEQCIRDAGGGLAQVYSTFSNTGFTDTWVNLEEISLQYDLDRSGTLFKYPATCTAGQSLPALTGLTCASAPYAVPPGGTNIQAGVRFLVTQSPSSVEGRQYTAVLDRLQ